jgi:dTDP-4-dehydrorhamnose 3,5-epimerase
MKRIGTPLEGLVIIEPDVFADSRGFFMETFSARRYDGICPGLSFVQDNLSFSVKGTLRGLHFQITRPQAKIVQVFNGAIYDVAVDIRPDSPTFGRWAGVHLSGDNHRQLFISPGFAHGFCVLSDTALFSYKCSDYYAPADEGGILWNDPDLTIDWPVADPILSPKDLAHQRLCQLGPPNLYQPQGRETRNQP